MKIVNHLLGLGLITILGLHFQARAEGNEIEQQEPKLETASKSADYESRLKEKYNITDDQLKKLRADGMNDSQITIAAHLAQASGKSITDIEKMRVEQKMGWGKIAKELGVSPKEIGQGIAAMHSNENSDKLKRETKLEDKIERKKERDERKADRAERKQQRTEKRANKSNKGGN